MFVGRDSSPELTTIYSRVCNSPESNPVTADCRCTADGKVVISKHDMIYEPPQPKPRRASSRIEDKAALQQVVAAPRPRRRHYSQEEIQLYIAAKRLIYKIVLSIFESTKLNLFSSGKSVK